MRWVTRTMAVHVESLCWPEHQDGEEVGARNESDDQREAENARLLTKALGKHRILRPISLPENEGSDENKAQDEWCQDVC